MTTGGTTPCPHCGAQNEPGAVYCENCGQPLSTMGPGAPWPGGGRRAFAAAAGVVVVLLLVVGVAFAITRGGDDDGPEILETTEATVTPTEEATTTETLEASLTPDEEALYAHIPPAVGTENCEANANRPDEAIAVAVCELLDEDLVLEYYLLPDSDSMYALYDGFLADRDRVVDGGCPEETATDWDFGDDVPRGRWACYLTSPPEGDDAHLVWTHDDLLILSIVSHIGIDATTAPLVAFWRSSAGPEE